MLLMFWCFINLVCITYYILVLQILNMIIVYRCKGCMLMYMLWLWRYY